jgi:Domain of unknown function (DUF4394)
MSKPSVFLSPAIGTAPSRNATSRGGRAISRRLQWWLRGALLAALGLLTACEERSLAYALTSGGQIIGFDVQNPGTLSNAVTVSGLASGDGLLSLSYRPADGGFYAISTQNRLYKVDPASGLASLIGSAAFSGATLVSPVAAFDPARDQLRVVDAGHNLRVSAVDGSLVASDSPPVYATGDAHAGTAPNLVALGSMPLDGHSPATVYALDFATQSLVSLGSIGGSPQPADSGALQTVAKLGVSFIASGGFGSQPDGATSYAALSASTSGGASLYQLDLSNGTVTAVNTIGGGGYTVLALAVGPKRRISAVANGALATTTTATSASTQ